MFPKFNVHPKIRKREHQCRFFWDWGKKKKEREKEGELFSIISNRKMQLSITERIKFQKTTREQRLFKESTTSIALKFMIYPMVLLKHQ